MAACEVCEARRQRVEKPVPDLVTATPIEDPKGARECLEWILDKSNPKREEGPDFFVPGAVRVALEVVLVESEEQEDQIETLRDDMTKATKREEQMKALLMRAKTAACGPSYARLRADIDAVLRGAL